MLRCRRFLKSIIDEGIWQVPTCLPPPTTVLMYRHSTTEEIGREPDPLARQGGAPLEKLHSLLKPASQPNRPFRQRGPLVSDQTLIQSRCDLSKPFHISCTSYPVARNLKRWPASNSILDKYVLQKVARKRSLDTFLHSIIYTDDGMS